ncbi:helix-turn-helix transcriptional regulator [Paenibacillus tarimensis]|uniref:helix-turn-helix transcriptional regulator n=1 Tax=Paenibacillus tarimensis TaxID=416012 RepID=UPI001F23D6FE|nr:YafY family protein [Paenibacillus tarimensis]MCF2945971.1 YafY family transcriptional regulator [Paenibacillus tarimensis]
MKLERLLAIVMLLLGRKRISARELSERFEVSQRTIYRDIESLCAAGIPVAAHTGMDGGYEIMEQYRIERQYLTMEELESIIVALRGIHFTMDEKLVSGLLDKVSALVANAGSGQEGSETAQQMMIDLNPWHSGEAERKRLDSLKQAIASCRHVEFDYTNGRGEQTRRTCEPMLVVLKGYVWYLYGYCLLRKEFRIFRLSRIKQLELLPTSFVRRESEFTSEPLRWDSMLMRDRPLIRLKLLFEPASRALVEDRYEPEKIQEQPDGKLLVETVQPDEPWLYGWLLSFGTNVRVLEPRETASRLYRKAMEICKLYPDYIHEH